MLMTLVTLVAACLFQMRKTLLDSARRLWSVSMFQSTFIFGSTSSLATSSGASQHSWPTMVCVYCVCVCVYVCVCVCVCTFALSFCSFSLPHV